MPEPFNVSTWLVDRRVEAGDGARVAFLRADDVVTYADLQALVERAAAGLRAAGVRPEERVALVMRDGVEMAAAFLAALRIGAVAVPLNPLLPTVEVAAVVADSRARAVVLDVFTPALAQALGDGARDVRTVVTVGADDASADGGATPHTFDVVRWSGLLAAGGDGSPWTTWDESPGFWLCTSGTTGRPKLAMHRHRDLRVPCDGYAREVLDISADDRTLSAAPMFHAYGLGNSLAFPLAAGGCAVLEPARPPTPAVVAALVRRHRPTLFFAVPTFYAALLASDLPADAFAGVRQAVSAGEPLPAELLDRFRERFGVEILDGIGTTEMTHIFISNRRGAAVGGSSGTPVTGHRVRILDDDGLEVPVGQPGRLWVAGEAASSGYWCRTPETRATFVGDWVSTGDVYTVDEAGTYRHLGRRDDMLKAGAEWVSPGEVENVLLAHPGVAEAAVVGAPDGDGITRVVAFVVARDAVTVDPADVVDHCRDRIAGFKRPRRVVVVDALPKTATGKVLRADLRAVAASLLVAQPR